MQRGKFYLKSLPEKDRAIIIHLYFIYPSVTPPSLLCVSIFCSYTKSYYPQDTATGLYTPAETDLTDRRMKYQGLKEDIEPCTLQV